MADTSEDEINEFINGLASAHPEYTIGNFKSEFDAAVSRNPTLKEINVFLKFLPAADKKALTSSFRQQSLTSSFRQRDLTSSQLLNQSLSKSSLGLSGSTTRLGMASSAPLDMNKAKLRECEGNDCQIKPLSDKTERCVFAKVGRLQSVFVNTLLTKGVYRWTIKVEFSGYGHPEFSLDGYNGKDISYYDKHQVGEYEKGLRYGFEIHEGFDDHGSARRTCIVVRGTHTNMREKPLYVDVTQNSLLTIELNVDMRVMCLLINNTYFQRGISDIKTPLILGISSANNNAFTSVSFLRMPPTTHLPRGIVWDKCLS